MGVKSITQEALAAEERADYTEALRLYKEAVGCDSWSDGQPSQVEEDLWDDSMLEVRALQCNHTVTTLYNFSPFFSVLQSLDSVAGARESSPSQCR